ATFPENLFYQNGQPPRIRWDSDSYTLAEFQAAFPGQAAGSFTASPQFIEPSFRPGPASPAVDAGVTHAAYATFFSLYGIDISRDADRTPRPQGLAFDMGAYERAASSDFIFADGFTSGNLTAWSS